MNSDSTPNKQTENNVVTLPFSIYPDVDISSNKSELNMPDKPTYNNGKIIINDTLFYKIKTINSYDTCPITFESISDNDIVSKIINCGHYFKPESLHKWCEKNTTCPVCRCNIGNTIISNSQRVRSNINTSTYNSNAYNRIRRTYAQTSRTIIQPSMATSSLSGSRVLF